MKYQSLVRVAITLVTVVLAVVAGHILWSHYVDSPWTRDGRVRSDVVQVAPDVSGPVVQVAVKDNQQVKRGDLLFEIDRERYRLAFAQAEANVQGRQAEMGQRKRELERRKKLTESAITVEALEQAENALDMARSAYQQAIAARDTAKVNLDRTEIRSPVNGFVTNLMVRVGEYANSGKALLAVVDSDSFYVAGYFEETKVKHIRVGAPVTIRLMAYDEPLTGYVHSITSAIVDRDNPVGSDLIPNVNPSFSWVRLAQRIPVRISIEHVPTSVRLTSGMSATVIVEEESPKPSQ